jgi:GxxExxY protein
MMELLLKDEVYQIVGAAIEVHRELGSGFLEAVYQEALAIEFGHRHLPHLSQPRLELFYKNIRLEKIYCPDFLCYDAVIVELKALNRLAGSEDAQVINYLKATSKRVGLLINFGSQGKLEWKKIVL